MLILLMDSLHAGIGLRCREVGRGPGEVQLTYEEAPTALLFGNTALRSEVVPQCCASPLASSLGRAGKRSPLHDYAEPTRENLVCRMSAVLTSQLILADCELVVEPAVLANAALAGRVSAPSAAFAAHASAPSVAS